MNIVCLLVPHFYARRNCHNVFLANRMSVLVAHPVQGKQAHPTRACMWAFKRRFANLRAKSPTFSWKDQNFGDTERSKMDYFVPFRIQCDKIGLKMEVAMNVKISCYVLFFQPEKRASLCATLMATPVSIPRCQCHVMVILAPFLTWIAYFKAKDS